MNYPDHRRIGRQLGIFATDERCGTGLPLWLPAGAAVRAEIERYIVDLERRYDYQHVYTPELAKRELFERSGHWAHYRDDMYPPMEVGGDGALPVWLRPTQVVILPVVTDAVSYAVRLRDRLRRRSLRVQLDDRDATLAARIRDAQGRHIPYLAVVGRRETQQDTVSVRLRTGEQLAAMSAAAFADLAHQVAAERSSPLLPTGSR